MGLDSIEIPEKLERSKVPLGEETVIRIDRYKVTKTYHGPVFEGKERPRYIRFNLIDDGFEDKIIKKRSRIIDENNQDYIKLKDKIIHTARVMHGIQTNYFEDSS